MKKSTTEKKNIPHNKTMFVVYGIIILFLLFIFTFVFWRPFIGEITQDRPLIKKLCEMQVECGYGLGDYGCSKNGILKQSSIDKLQKWKDFHGCNESTRGFHYKEDIKWGYISVESCTCGGLM